LDKYLASTGTYLFGRVPVPYSPPTMGLGFEPGLDLGVLYQRMEIGHIF
jgi:hypothetical protein